MSKVMRTLIPSQRDTFDRSDSSHGYCRVGRFPTRSECTSPGTNLVFPPLPLYLANVAGVAVGEQRGCPTHPVEDGCRHVGRKPCIPAAYGTA